MHTPRPTNNAATPPSFRLTARLARSLLPFALVALCPACREPAEPPEPRTEAVGVNDADIEGELLELVGEVSLPGRTRSILLFGDIAVIAFNLEGLAWVDIADPAHPRLLDHRSRPNPIAMQARGERVYMAERGEGLSAWDFSEPLAPRRLARVPVEGRASGLALDDRGHIFVACGEAGVAVYRHDHPATLTLTGRFRDKIDYTKDVDLLGDLAILADNFFGGVKGVEIDPITTPSLRWLVRAPHCFFDQITLVDDVAYASVRHQVTLIDLADRDKPSMAGFLWRGEERGKVTATWRRGDVLFVLRDTEGIDCYDVSRAREPRFIGHTALAVEVAALAWREGLLYAGDWRWRFRVYRPEASLARRLDEGRAFTN